MTKRECVDLYFWDLRPDSPLCVNCKHFHRHFLYGGRPLMSGHCVYPRIKTRDVFETCNNFILRWWPE